MDPSIGGGSMDPSIGGDHSLWEDMILRENKEKAAQLGITVAEFEEQLHIQKAVESSRVAEEKEDALPSPMRERTEKDRIDTGNVVELAEDSDEDDEVFECGDSNVDLKRELILNSLPEGDREESLWEGLPGDVTLLVHEYIGDVDMLGYLACVSRQLIIDKNEPTRLVQKQGLCFLNQLTYKYYCEQVFLRQFPDRKLNLAKFCSWQSMLIHRPRLRTNGFYTLKTLHTRAPCNDNFWEERKTKSIETAWNRHMRFYDGGVLLYSLSTEEAHEMPLGDEYNMKPIHKKVFVGSYVAKGKELSVSIPMHYCTIMFDLRILDGNMSYSMYGGKHSVLQILTHSQLARDGSRYELNLPVNCDMKFYRLSYLSAAHNDNVLVHADEKAEDIGTYHMV